MGRAGFVLVGGKSSRMGRDKALLSHQGTTLVEHVAAQVVAAAGSATLIGPPERYEFLGLPVVADSVSNFGPVAGIQAALQATGEDWNLIVACDMPSVSADFLRSLFEAAEQCGADCLVPHSPSGLPEPLCAVYHRNCLAGINRAIGEDLRKTTSALSKLRVSAWPVSESLWFQNLNTPEDLATYRHG
jgi:molybdopterin-guanine dinucleotide biosynthesis protein A